MLPTVVAILAAAALVGWLSQVVASGATLGFDTWITLAMRQPGDLAIARGPTWLLRAMRDITALGDVTVLTLVAGIAIGFALVRRHAAEAAFIAVTTSGGAILNSQLKLIFARLRPTLVPHLADVTAASFPSGHAMNSSVVYLTICAVLAGRSADRRVRGYLMAVGVALPLVIGLSRVFLGVHFPTDVIAGWITGASWAALCWLVGSRWLRITGAAPLPGEVLPLAAQPAKAREP